MARSERTSGLADECRSHTFIVAHGMRNTEWIVVAVVFLPVALLAPFGTSNSDSFRPRPIEARKGYNRLNHNLLHPPGVSRAASWIGHDDECTRKTQENKIQSGLASPTKTKRATCERRTPLHRRKIEKSALSSSIQREVCSSPPLR